MRGGKRGLAGSATSDHRVLPVCLRSRAAWKRRLQDAAWLRFGLPRYLDAAVFR